MQTESPFIITQHPDGTVSVYNEESKGLYTLTPSPKGWLCNCPDFVLRKQKAGLPCKHIRALVEQGAWA